MASQARKTFDENFKDIENLLDYYHVSERFHEDYPNDGLMEGADVVLRSAVVLLVTYWEAYLEDIVTEAIEHIVIHVVDSTKIPKELKKTVIQELKKDNNELALWKLTSDGWRDCIKSRLPQLTEARNRSFNTPKSLQTQTFIQSALGIVDITKNWTFQNRDARTNTKYLDVLVDLRGQIAHRGKIKKKITDETVRIFSIFVKELVSKTGGSINAEVKKIAGSPMWTKKV
jgi:hypothetical protein